MAKRVTKSYSGYGISCFLFLRIEIFLVLKDSHNNSPSHTHTHIYPPTQKAHTLTTHIYCQIGTHTQQSVSFQPQIRRSEKRSKPPKIKLPSPLVQYAGVQIYTSQNTSHVDGHWMVFCVSRNREEFRSIQKTDCENCQLTERNKPHCSEHFHRGLFGGHALGRVNSVD